MGLIKEKWMFPFKLTMKAKYGHSNSYFLDLTSSSEQLHDLLDKVKEDMKCDSNVSIRCDLNKLLFYETGSHQSKHNHKP